MPFSGWDNSVNSLDCRLYWKTALIHCSKCDMEVLQSSVRDMFPHASCNLKISLILQCPPSQLPLWSFVISGQPSAPTKLHRHSRGLHILSYQIEPSERSKNNCSEISRFSMPRPPCNNSSSQTRGEAVVRPQCSRFVGAHIFLKLTQKSPCSLWALSATRDSLCKTLLRKSLLIFLHFRRIVFCNLIGLDLERQDCKQDIFRIWYVP